MENQDDCVEVKHLFKSFINAMRESFVDSLSTHPSSLPDLLSLGFNSGSLNVDGTSYNVALGEMIEIRNAAGECITEILNNDYYSKSTIGIQEQDELEDLSYLIDEKWIIQEGTYKGCSIPSEVSNIILGTSLSPILSLFKNKKVFFIPNRGKVLRNTTVSFRIYYFLKMTDTTALVSIYNYEVKLGKNIGSISKGKSTKTLKAEAPNFISRDKELKSYGNVESIKEQIQIARDEADRVNNSKQRDEKSIDDDGMIK
jgi:hypothetical protein